MDYLKLIWPAAASRTARCFSSCLRIFKIRWGFWVFSCPRCSGVLKAFQRWDSVRNRLGTEPERIYLFGRRRHPIVEHVCYKFLEAGRLSSLCPVHVFLRSTKFSPGDVPTYNWGYFGNPTPWVCHRRQTKNVEVSWTMGVIYTRLFKLVTVLTQRFLLFTYSSTLKNVKWCLITCGHSQVTNLGPAAGLETRKRPTRDFSWNESNYLNVKDRAHIYAYALN